MTPTELEQIFTQQVEQLGHQAEQIWLDYIGTDQSEWQMPPRTDEMDWEGDPLDLPRLQEAFNRDEANQAYELLLADKENPGTTGQAAAIKLQIDYVATLERAFRTRHSTYCRAAAHAAARQRGQGDYSGLFRRHTLAYVQNLLRAGQRTPPEEAATT